VSRKRKPRKDAGEPQFRPKPGPGSVFIEESVSARTGNARRMRNIAEHPLTLAHARGRISDEQFAAGEEVRLLCEMRGLSGHDSSLMARNGGSGAHMPFTQSQVDAIRRLDQIRTRLKDRDWTIVEKFCGEGWSMADSVRAATLCHPSGVLMRLQEALDELVAARGRRGDSEKRRQADAE
jgi:hypothetical protein